MHINHQCDPTINFFAHATIEHQTVSDREMSSKVLKTGRLQAEEEKEKDRERERESKTNYHANAWVSKEGVCSPGGDPF